jgi:hypothetical protein
MPTSAPAIRVTSGLEITSGFLTVNGQSVRISTAANTYFSFINANTSAAYKIEEYGLTRGTLAASATVEIDLFDGTLKNLFDQSVVFDRLKLASIFITDSNYEIGGATAGGQLRIGNAATNGNPLWFGAIGNTQTIYPRGCPFLQGDPTGVVVNGTSKRILLENTHATQAVFYVAVFAGEI